MIRIPLIGAVLCALALASPARAQSGSQDSQVPEGYRPPRGMCRIWIDGVPAGRQPAPTDCPTAIKRRPTNARVIFGEPVEERQDDNSKRSEKKPKQNPAYVKKLREDRKPN